MGMRYNSNRKIIIWIVILISVFIVLVIYHWPFTLRNYFDKKDVDTVKIVLRDVRQSRDIDTHVLTSSELVAFYDKFGSCKISKSLIHLYKETGEENTFSIGIYLGNSENDPYIENFFILDTGEMVYPPKNYTFFPLSRKNTEIFDFLFELIRPGESVHRE